MSALSIVQRSKATAYHRRCAVDTCNRSPRYEVLMLGYPVGRVCAQHRTEWQRAWDEAAPALEEIACLAS